MGFLSPTEVIEPFEMVGWDLMGPFPASIIGNRYILVMTEYLTRWCITVPIPEISIDVVVIALL
jgi:hypothetical protein